MADDALRTACIKMVTEQMDNVCWMDAYREIAHLVGVEINLKLLTREQMLTQCGRFIDSLLTGCPYAVDAGTAAVVEYDKAMAVLAGHGYTEDIASNGLAAVVGRMADRIASAEAVGMDRDTLE